MATDSLKSKSVTIRFNCTKRILFDYQTHGDPSRSYTIGRVPTCSHTSTRGAHVFNHILFIPIRCCARMRFTANPSGAFFVHKGRQATVCCASPQVFQRSKSVPLEPLFSEVQLCPPNDDDEQKHRGATQPFIGKQ